MAFAPLARRLGWGGKWGWRDPRWREGGAPMEPAAKSLSRAIPTSDGPSLGHVLHMSLEWHVRI